VHLLDLINKSPHLANVFKAVTLNGKSIVMTALLGLVLIYLYAIVMFNVTQDAILLDNYPDEDIPMCTNLLVCWVGAINEGLRASDIGAIMEPARPDEAFGMFVFNFVFQFTFWVLVITILLNVIFGIIIDTFGELRANHTFKKNHMENTCFVCGIDRFRLDTKGNGFERHIKEDHYMWWYLFLVVYLNAKESTAYNGWEQYVASKLKVDDFSFVPRNSAVVLKEVQEREEAESKMMSAKISSMYTTTETLAAEFAQLKEVQVSSHAEISQIKETQMSTLAEMEMLSVGFRRESQTY